ncbi:MAG TPA: hypothetical protein VGD79_05265 [Thermoanaerobaculia bacterium]
MRIVARFGIAFAIALLLPFSGPHVDRYVPIAGVLFRRDAASADAGFFALTAIVIAIYTAIIFGLLVLIARVRAPRRRA